MNRNVDQHWFKDRWKQKGLSLRKVAKLVDMDPGALSYTLSGKRRMKLSEAGKIATIMGATRDEVIDRWEGLTEHANVGKGESQRKVSQSDAASSDRSQDASQGVGAASEAKEGKCRPLYPGFGFMKGLIRIEPGFDVTGPSSDESWEDGYLGEDRLGESYVGKKQK